MNFIENTGFVRETGSPLTPLQHSINIFHQYIMMTFFSTMIGKASSGKPIIIDTELFKGKTAGDVSRFHFIPQYYGPGIIGQDVDITGNEKLLSEFYTDMKIDQIAQAFKKTGKMTGIRSIWDFRAEASAQLRNWFAYQTETDFIDAFSGEMYNGFDRYKGAELLSKPMVNGDGRCVFSDYTSATSRKTKMITGANSNTTSLLGTLGADDSMNTYLLDELNEFALHGNDTYPMKPYKTKDGKEYYLLVIHPKAAIQLRRDARWEKRMLSSYTGSKTLDSDPIANGAMGVWNKIIIKEAPRVKSHTNSAGTLTIHRNLLMGADCAALAYAQNLNYDEEQSDHKRKLSIAADEIRGIKKLDFNGVDQNIAQVITAEA